MDEARQASLWAQQLNARCGHLCSQSQEGTERMHLDIRQSLELRIKEEEFWISELQQRTTRAKRTAEKVEAAEKRLDRAILVSHQLLDANHRCVKQRKKAILEVDAVMEFLLEEADVIAQELRCTEENRIKTKHRKECLEWVCRSLDDDIENKYVALETDRQSLALRLRNFDLRNAPLNDTLINSIRNRDFPINPQDKWLATVDARVRTADDEIRLAEQHLQEVQDVFKSMNADLASQVAKVTQVMQEHVVQLQKEKSDLEQHLDMTNAHMEVTKRTMSQLLSAIKEKELAIQMTNKRLALHYARPPPELRLDDVQVVIEQQLADAEGKMLQMGDQIPVLEATLRSLRRARLEIGQKIANKMEHIETEDLKCLGIRTEMTTFTL